MQKIPLHEGRLNVIANSHAAYLSLNNREDALVVSIKPPNLLERRYGIKDAVWLTYFPQGYHRAYSPDRIEFEIMDVIVEEVKSGKRVVFLDCADYLLHLHGKKKVYDWLLRIKDIGPITLVIATNSSLEEWKGIGEAFYEERLKVPEPVVSIVDKIKKDDNTLLIALEDGEDKINVGNYSDTERFLFEGLDRIMRSGKKNVGIEAIDYLINTSEPLNLLKFFKDLVDVVVYGGGEIKVLRTDEIYRSSLLLLFEKTGLEHSDIFLDREEETEKIKKIIDGHGKKAVMIAGEVGIGKTTLVMRIKNYAIMRGYRFLYSRAYYESGEPYLPIRDAFGKYVGEIQEEGFAPHDEKSFESQRNAMFYDFANRIRELTKREKILVFFDDIHWMDSSSLRFFHYLVSNLKDSPIIFIAAYRSKEMNEDLKDVLARMNRENLYEMIELKGLDYKHVKEIAEYMLDAPVPESIVRRIYEKTGGNPLFVKELINNMHGEMNWQLENLEMSIPQLIKDIVDRKLRRLSKEERKIVEIASVLGYKVNVELLAQLQNGDEMLLFEMLENIEEKGIWEEDESGEAYVFGERIIRDGIYHGISKMRRRILDRKIAELLEKIHADEPKYYHELALHYRKAGIGKKAYEYYILAGDHAEKVYAHESAVNFYSKAAELAMDEKQRAEVYERLGGVYQILGEHDLSAIYYMDALETYQKLGKQESVAKMKLKLGDLSEKMGKFEKAKKYTLDALNLADSDEMKSEIYNLLSWIHFRLGKYDDAFRMAKEAIRLAEKTGNNKNTARGYKQLGSIYWMVGRYRESVENFHKALEMNKKIGDSYELASVYNGMGIVYTEMGEFDKAVEYYENSLMIAEKMKYAYLMAITYGNMAVLYDMMGNLKKALEYNQKSLEMSKRISNLYGIAASYNNMSIIYEELGDMENSLEYSGKSIEVREKMGDKEGLATSYCNMAKVYMEMGDMGKAWELIEMSMNIAQENSFMEVLFDCYGRLADYYSSTKNFKDALNYADLLLKEAEKTDSEQFLMLAHRTRGIVLRKMGRYDEGEKELSIALELGKKLHMEVEYHIALYELGVLLNKKGNKEKSMAYLDEALEYFKSRGFKYYQEQIKKTLGDN